MDDDVCSTCSSSTSWSSTSSNHYQRKRLFTAIVENVPKILLSQQEIMKTLRQIPNLRVESVEIFKNNVLSVRSSDRYISEKLTQSLPDLVGQPLKIYVPVNKTFSCVIKGVPLEVSAVTVVDHLKKQNFDVKAAFRIKSRATEEFTRMFRVISDKEECVNNLIRSGLEMNNRVYRVEPAKLPQIK